MDLSEGDFLYQADQELFLVVTEETEKSYKFAVHGWREIGKERLDEYIEDEHMSLHRGEQVEQIVEEDGSDEMRKRFDQLRELLFETYADAELEDEGPHTDFILEDIDE